MPKVPKTTLHIFAISPQKHGRMKLIFCLQINKNVFYKMIVSLWVCGARQVQSTKKKKFKVSLLQYLKENMKNEVDFLPAQKHCSLSQVDTSF